MNKKKLSVVMAGAMLATSVAPVLAAETTGTEIAYDQLATFKSDILAKMAEKKISNYALFKDESLGFVDKKIADELKLNNKDGEFSSLYGIKITGKDGKVKLDTTYRVDESTTEGLKVALDSLAAGDKVEVFEREKTEFKGQIIPGTGLKITVAPEKYMSTDFVAGLTTVQDDIAPDNSVMVKDKTTNVTKDTKNDILNVVTEKLIDPVGANDASNKLTLSYNVDEEKVDGRLPLDKDGNLLDYTAETDVLKLAKFDKLATWQASSEAADKGAKLVETYTIGEKPADESKETLTIADLFDGIALTARGTEIVSDLNNARKAALAEGLSINDALVKLGATPGAVDTNTGLTNFTISYYKNSANATSNSNPEKVITVVANNQNELKALYNIINSGKFRVGVVAGENRYETAVNVAKANELEISVTNNNIVLVNGSSLVDGLAAAPLAASANSNGTKQAPLLLANKDSLPTATKEFISSELDKLNLLQKKKVVVNLVGGEAVLSSSLVSELEDMGVTVKRIGGANREATSVAVAKSLSATTKAFVVGANGEADAMSISAVAADATKGKGGNTVTPIIVSKAGGLSSDALNYLREAKADDVTIVGGTSVVSKSEEEAIDKALPGVKAMRLAGDNRFETNNKIIEEFYTASAEGVLVVKDGVAKKDELIDALSAANYAAANKAPIVLATSTVTDTQKNTLLKAKTKTTSNFDLLAQVGMGAERTVLESLAKLLDIKNNQ